MDENKKETKVEILTLDDIYLHATAILKIVECYDNKKVSVETQNELN
jgi:hypothetical protein